MSKINWIYYSGCPPIVIPTDIQSQWCGMFVPTESDSPDLELSTGEKFEMFDEMNFENPVTDYDRACHVDSQFTYQKVIPIGAGEGVVVSTTASFTWWQERQLLIWDEWWKRTEPKKEYTEAIFRGIPLNELNWTEKSEWQQRADTAIIMNSANHGAEPEGVSDLVVTAELKPSVYQIEFAQHRLLLDDGNEVMLGVHRFMSF
jgi:hypothetical protein